MQLNRAFSIPAAMIGVAAIVSAIGVGSHAGQTVVIAGDSLTALGADQITAVLTGDGWKPTVDGQAGSSITNRNDVFYWPARMRDIAAFQPDVVVVELGTNDCGNCGLDLDGAIDQILIPLRRVQRVVWLTAETDVPFPRDPGAVNEAVRRATVRWPNLEILDMGDHFAGHPEWHIGDGLHFTEEGSVELGNLIRAAIDTPPSRVGALSAVV